MDLSIRKVLIVTAEHVLTSRVTTAAAGEWLQGIQQRVVERHQRSSSSRGCSLRSVADFEMRIFD